MTSLYILLKFLHVMSSITWIGGTLAIAILIARIAREADPALLVAMARQGRFYGGAVLTPAVVLQLITGLAMVFGYGMSLSLWVVWGIAAIIVVVALVQTMLLPTLNAVIDGEAIATREDQPLATLQRKLVRVYAIILLVLLSAEWAMVYKPSL